MYNIGYKLYYLKEKLKGNFWFAERKQPIADKQKRLEAKKILDIEFVKKYIAKKGPQLLKDYKGTHSLEQKIFKQSSGKTNTTCVVRYKLNYIDKGAKKQTIELFFSSGTDGSRLKAYNMTKLLIDNGFNADRFKVIIPLDYIKKQSCLVYIGTPGKNLLKYIESGNSNLENMVRVSAQWIKKLHNFDLNKLNHPLLKTDRVNMMLPAPSFCSYWLTKSFGVWGIRINKYFNQIIRLEKKHLKSIRQTLIYGDYHPENIIFANDNSNDLTMIDLTDLSLGDPYRDIGTFLQQLSFMSRLFLPKQIRYNLKKIFIEEYFQKNYYDLPIATFQRINLYQAWTALRSAVVVFFTHGSKDLVFELIDDAGKYLDKIKNKEKTVNIK